MIASKNIEIGEEITTDYSNTPKYIMKPNKISAEKVDFFPDI